MWPFLSPATAKKGKKHKECEGSRKKEIVLQAVLMLKPYLEPALENCPSPTRNIALSNST